MKTGLALAAAAFAIGLVATSSQAATSSRIVFSADRTPTVTGEIYRVDSSGHRVDLSKSPYQDLYPAVSSDGKHVAFLSDRSGTFRLYQVGRDGRGLVRLGLSVPLLYAAECDPELAWQPHGNVLAVAACGSSKGWLWIVHRGAKPLKLLTGKYGVQGVSWSPDGRVLAASPSRGVYRAFSPTGRPLWQAKGGCCGSWSPQGLLALPLGSGSGFRVYDESGHTRFGASGTVSSSLAWSPDGRLAVIRANRLEVRTATGQLVFGKPLPGRHGLVWADGSHVIVGGYGACECKAKSVAIPSGKTSAASDAWFDTLSPDRKLAIVTPKAKPGKPFVLGVQRPTGGTVKTYTHVPGCWGDQTWIAAATSLQFVGRSRSLVYQSGNFCDPPFANLYSVAPGGGKVQRLTNAQAQETQPALSPDGSKIAFVWADKNGMTCAGCSDGIRVVGSDGTGARTLTNPENCTFDDSPTWSPDGSTILFAETGCDSAPELFTIAASGDKPQDLKILGRNPAWGPSRIAYVGSDKSDRGLWTANPDGSGRVLVAKNGRLPAWSPDGRLAYLVGNTNPTAVVGSTTAKLPFAQVTSFAWSPDGTRFVVTARTTKTGLYDVYTVKTDGTGRSRLTKNYGVLGAWRG